MEIKAGHSWTTDNFAQLSWHDNYVHGLRFRYEENDEGVANDLVFELDLILTHCCDPLAAQAGKSLIAPGELVFSRVSDLKIVVDQTGTLGGGFGLEGIERKPLAQNCLNVPHFAWSITLVRDCGLITFESPGFRQVILTDPIWSDCLALEDAERSALLSAKPA